MIVTHVNGLREPTDVAITNGSASYSEHSESEYNGMVCVVDVRLWRGWWKTEANICIPKQHLCFYFYNETLDFHNYADVLCMIGDVEENCY